MYSNLGAALHYVSQGLAVIPLCWPDELGHCACGRNHVAGVVGKAPLINEWQKIRQVSEQQANEWWSQWPQANIGLLLPANDLLVVDADSDEAIREIEEKGLPSTAVLQSHRGRHYLFRRGDAPMARAVHKGETRDVDVLSAGYTILPPSRHRLGSTYRWLTDEISFSSPPDWAVKWLEESRTEQAVDVELPPDLPSLGIRDLRVSDFVKKLIVQGLPAAAGRYDSRSEASFAVIRILLKAGHTPSEIAFVMLNDEWAIGSKYREKPDPVDFVRREIGRCLAKGGDDPGEPDELGDLRDRVLDPDQLLALVKDQKVEWLIEGLVPTGMLLLLVGRPKGGKTTLAFHAARAIASGGLFLGHQAHKAPVIYINFEMHPRTVVEMYATIISDTDTGLWPRTVQVPTVPTSKERIKSYLAQFDKKGLVIMDSARGAFGLRGDAENHAGEMGYKTREVMEAARESGWTIMLIHHSHKGAGYNKPSVSDAAGSFDVVGAADEVWVWQPEEHESEPGYLLMDGRIHRRETYRVLLSRDICERVMAEGTPSHTAVLTALAEFDEPVNATTLADTVGLSVRQIRRVLEPLVSNGQVEQVDLSGKKLYRLAAH